MLNIKETIISIAKQIILDIWNIDLPYISVRESQNTEDFDYQLETSFLLAKNLKLNPKIIADTLAKELSGNDFFSLISVTGAGFINLRIDNKKLIENFNYYHRTINYGMEAVKKQLTIVIDYSSPNVAKEMHVGHLRSSIIGDSLARIYEFLGHKVIRQNHIGDWGTQFGFLLQYIIENNLKPKNITDLSLAYRQSREKFDTDKEFEKKSRDRLVKLQSKNEDTFLLWQEICKISFEHFDEISSKLNLLLKEEDIRGESYYNYMLNNMVNSLIEDKVAEESNGAIVIFMPEFVDKEKNPLPMIIKKSDGGFLYHTTDLAAAKFRINELNADKIIYVTDARQKQHFEMLFSAVKIAGWGKDTVFSHIGFGSVLGEDKKPFKSRSGEVISLASLLDEAIEKAYNNLVNRHPDYEKEILNDLAKKIGIGALKYADLSTELNKDYVFSFERMLAFNGNTAPYLQNAYVRVLSIFRKENIDITNMKNCKNDIVISEEIERKLLLKTLEFPGIINSVADNLSPNLLCNYLYDLANLFHKFYETCSISKAPSSIIQLSRISICYYLSQTIKQGLYLLGIETVDVM